MYQNKALEITNPQSKTSPNCKQRGKKLSPKIKFSLCPKLPKLGGLRPQPPLFGLGTLPNTPPFYGALNLTNLT